jgi:hypothetical protein
MHGVHWPSHPLYDIYIRKVNIKEEKLRPIALGAERKIEICLRHVPVNDMDFFILPLHLSVQNIKDTCFFCDMD